jgi:hypothetical protein
LSNYNKKQLLELNYNINEETYTNLRRREEALKRLCCNLLTNHR